MEKKLRVWKARRGRAWGTQRRGAYGGHGAVAVGQGYLPSHSGAGDAFWGPPPTVWRDSVRQPRRASNSPWGRDVTR